MKKKLTGRLSNLARKIIKLFIKIAFYFLTFLIFLIILLYIPPVQNYVSNRVESILSRKADSEIKIGALNLNLFGNLIIKDVSIKDPSDVTVFEVDAIDIDIQILPIIIKEIHLNHIIVSGLKSSLEINTELKKTNLDFLIEAFSNNKPKENAKPSGWKISVSDLRVEESSYTLYIYKVLELQTNIGKLKLINEGMDLKNLNFNIREIELANSNVFLQIFDDSLALPVKEKNLVKPKNYSNVTSKLDQVNISNSKFTLEMDGLLDLLTIIPDFNGQKIQFDLQKHLIRASNLVLDDATTEIAYSASMKEIDSPKLDTPNNSDLFIKNFNWDIGSGNTALNNCDFKFDNLSVPDSSQTFSDDHFQIKDIHVSMKEAKISNQYLSANVESAGFTTGNGFRLQDSKGNLKYENDKLSIQDLMINSENSHLHASMNVSGNLSESIIDHPQDLTVNVDVLDVEIRSADLDYFSTSNILKESGINLAQLNTNASGSLRDLQIEKLNLNFDNDITLDLKGNVKNINDFDNICFDKLESRLYLKTESLYDIIDSLQRSEINYPAEITIAAELQGCIQDLNANTLIQTNESEQIVLNAKYKYPGKGIMDSLFLHVKGDGLLLGQLFHIDKIGEIYFNADVQMSDLFEEPGKFEIDMYVDSILINEHPVQNIRITTSYEADSLIIHLAAIDSLVNLALDIKGQKHDSIYSFNAGLDLKKFDMSFLELAEKPISLSGQLETNQRVGMELFDGSFTITNATIVSEKTYKYDTILLDVYKMADSVSLNLQSDFINGQFLTDIPLQDLDERILDFYSPHFIKDSTKRDNTRSGSVHFNLESQRSLENIILLVPGLEELQFSKIEGEINEKEKTSSLIISVPRITYQGIHLDSLNYNLISQPDDLHYSFSIPGISYQNYSAKDFSLSGRTMHGIVNNVLALPNKSDSYLIRAGFDIMAADENQFVIRFDPDSLIISSKIWSVKGENEIIYDRSGDIFGKIDIDDGHQSLQINAIDSLYEFDINNFQLVNLSNLLRNFDPEIDISGELNFKSDVISANQELQVNANLSLEDFYFQKTRFGDITIEAANSGPNNVRGKIFLENGANKLSIEGDYNLNKKTNPLTAEAKMDFHDLDEFISFGKGFIEDPEGSIKGQISLSGDKNKINTNGKIDFKSVEMLLTPVSNYYKINGESISIKNNTLLFQDFALLDSARQQFIVNGTVNTESFNLYNMDLKLDADRFTVYNVNQFENPHFYGSLIVSMDAILKGSTENPNILVNLSVDRGTNLTYTLPSKNFDVVDSEGIVEFVSHSDPDSLQEIGFEQLIGDTIFSKLNWIDLNASLTIDRSAQFMVDMDPLSGDYIQFGGVGDLNLLVQKQQNPQITGTYEFDRGIYEVSFYGLVKKTFEFEKGSIISWSGDPYNAQLILKARHNIRTASIGLVSREIYGLSDEEKSKYRRTLPYSVDIIINGQLDRPEISFGIDLPEEEKNGFPLVETKLNQLAEPGNESELTRQVFGLLTIGSFIPETTGPGAGSDYGSALATTAAANSLNSILTNELNKMSGKYITFADLDIGMQTFSDISTGGQTNRTTMDIRLSKKLFNDRVTIEAQSSFDLHNEADKYQHATDQNNVHSDFAIIYDLTEKGDYKLKAFERSAYDIIYKDTRMGGVAIIFIKEFDKYKKDRKSRK